MGKSVEKNADKTPEKTPESIAEKTVQVAMKDGTKKYLAGLTHADLPDIKLTSKSSGGTNLTNLTMKTEVISETATHWIERRLYKWTTMPKLVMYDLHIPKDLDTLILEKGKKVVYGYAIGNYAIAQDKLHNGIEPRKADPVKTLDKIVVSLMADGMTKEEAEKTVSDTRKMLLARGFGK